MKRTPLPARTKSIPRVRLKRPRVATQRSPGSIGSGGSTITTTERGKSLRPAATGPKKKPFRFGGVHQNPAYLVFVRIFPCILTGLRGSSKHPPHVCSGRIEAAHTGRRGMKQKAADETALPMCVNAHRTGKYAHHKLGKKFWSFWGLDQAEFIRNFNEIARESGVLVQEFKS